MRGSVLTISVEAAQLSLRGAWQIACVAGRLPRVPGSWCLGSGSVLGDLL